MSHRERPRVAVRSEEERKEERSGKVLVGLPMAAGKVPWECRNCRARQPTARPHCQEPCLAGPGPGIHCWGNAWAAGLERNRTRVFAPMC